MASLERYQKEVPLFAVTLGSLIGTVEGLKHSEAHGVKETPGSSWRNGMN